MTVDPFQSSHEDRDSWKPINLNTLEKKPPVQPTLGQLGDIGLVYPGLRHVFSGPPESAKTLAAYLVIIATVRDHGNGDAILIDFEMGAYNARDRLIDLGATPEDLERIHYVEPEAPASAGRLQYLLETFTPSLVVIDASAGAYDLQGLDDNSRRDVGHIYRLYVEPFFRAGVATIFLDHVVKNTETRGKFAIGSERKVGVADVHLGFETIRAISRGTSGLYKIHTHKDRGGFHKRGILAELELTSDPETHSINYELRPERVTDEDHPWVPTKVMQHISELLEKQVEAPTMNQLAELAGGTRKIALLAITELVRLGYATSTPGPRNSKLLHHTRPFTVLEWENQPDPPTGSDRFATGSPNQSPSLVRDPPFGGRTEPVETPQEPLTGSAWIDDLNPVIIPPADDIPF